MNTYFQKKQNMSSKKFQKKRMIQKQKKLKLLLTKLISRINEKPVL